MGKPKLTIEFTKYAELLILMIDYMPGKLCLSKWFLTGVEKNPHRYLKTTYNKPPQ